MRLLATSGIVAGESGVAGLAGFRLAMGDTEAASALGLDAGSRVLAFNTEGATDPLLYEQLVRGSA
jgi:diaminopropionate ammonia-lyase